MGVPQGEPSAAGCARGGTVRQGGGGLRPGQHQVPAVPVQQPGLRSLPAAPALSLAPGITLQQN